jgi:hypothetical protein
MTDTAKIETMAKAATLRLREASFKGDAGQWGIFLARMYFGMRPLGLTGVPVGVAPLVAERAGVLELTGAGVAWLEESLVRYRASLADRASVEMAVSRALSEEDVPPAPEVSGEALVEALTKLQQVALGRGRKWEAKVAEKASRWIARRISERERGVA